MRNAHRIVFFLISAYLSLQAHAQAELSNDEASTSSLSSQNSLKDEDFQEDTNNKNIFDEDNNTPKKLELDDKGQPMFDTNMLHGRGNVEIASFSNLNNVPEGQYRVDFILNGDALTSVDINFKKFNDDIIPCFTKKLLLSLNVDFESLSADNLASLEKVEQGLCIPISEIISGATTDFEIGTFSLMVSIPQAFLKKVPRGYVNPEFWDKGINAATLKYRLGHYRTTGELENHSSYASIQGGLNVDGWNFRHFGYLSNQKIAGFSSESTYDSINTYVERALPHIGSNLTIGDSFTDGAVSESLGVRGIQLSTSDLMLPISQRGYAPVVRGLALTNAKVEIFQNGNLIYETTVAPGPFVIDDLYQSVNNSNLDVVVTEADGSKSNFIVPNSSMPQLVREGQFRYSVAAGKFRNAGSTTKSDLTKATGQYGVSNSWTAYAGLTLSKHYWASLIGSVYETDYGAFSSDMEFAKTQMKNHSITDRFTGNRVRIGYAQIFDFTKSNIDISAYSYNRNYWGMEAKANYDEYGSFVSPMQFLRARRRTQVAYSQPLDKYGSVYALASKSSYWNNKESLITAQIGYSNNFTINSYTFGLNFNYLKSKASAFGNMDNERFALTLTLPLDMNYASNLTATVAHDRKRGHSEQIRVNGVMGDEDRLNYGLYVDNLEGQSAISGGNLQYKTSSAILDGSASTGAGRSQISASVSGGVVMHSGGLTFANQLGNTVGLIHAPGAKGAVVKNSQGIEVDSNGYAVVPYLQAYQRNNILLDTQKVSTDVSFTSTTEQTIPYENSVSLLKYETAIGKSALFDIARDDATPPPFGSVAVLPDGKEVGVVGQGGSAFVYGLEEKGEFYVKWGEEPTKKCLVKYELDGSSVGNNAYAKKSVACTAVAE